MKGLSQKTVFRLVLLLGVCAFILANLCAGRLTLFFGLSPDFTGERLYSLSGATKLTASALRGETTIYVINDEGAYPSVLREILRRYAFLSAKINVRYVDPYADPAFVDDYNRKGFSLGEADLLVEGAEGLRHIPAGDLFIYDDEGAAAGLRLEER
ncbi:MAG: GldG family protein, partial [Treponema sp.]|nr:GldG family protein [Treponema sp.]